MKETVTKYAGPLAKLIPSQRTSSRMSAVASAGITSEPSDRLGRIVAPACACVAIVVDVRGAGEGSLPRRHGFLVPQSFLREAGRRHDRLDRIEVLAALPVDRDRLQARVALAVERER